ncbi:MAG: hypothetical protein RIC56_03530 [Pseudomonadales bacterium]
MTKSALIGLFAMLLLPFSAGAQAAQASGLTEDTGVIQELDLAARTLVIDGMRYDIAVDMSVEIGGSYGAFTMLQPGMRVYFEYRRESPTVRRISLLRELPGDVDLEEV